MDDRLNDPSFIISHGGISNTTTDRSGVVIITSVAVIMIAVCSSEGPHMQKGSTHVVKYEQICRFFLSLLCVCFVFVQCLNLLLLVVLVVATMVSMR